MNDLKKDILIGMMFIAGVSGFLAGEFIISTVVFGAASVFSNIHFTNKLKSAEV